MSCEKYREMMVEVLYREIDTESAREFEAHVSGCAECATLLEEMRATAVRMSERSRPDPGDAYWSNFYDRLEARMSSEQTVVDGAPIAARRRSYVSWGYRVAAAVAVLAMGVWIGRSTMTKDISPVNPSQMSSNQDQPTDTVVTPSRDEKLATSGDDAHDPIRRDRELHPAPKQNAEVVLASADVRAREYIERSQVLLLALVNSGADSTAGITGDFETRRARAGLLVSEGAALRDDLPGGENRRLRELVTDLQMILREIANLESDNDLDGVEIIRNRVDREGVLLQIDVEQMRDDNHAKETQTKRNGAID